MKNALIVEQGVPVTKHTYEHKRSLSTVTKGARRLSLGSLGSKITGLAHAKNAFNRFKKHSAIQPENDEVETFEIKQLPEKPRFASTLSPEAQFAIMKGYEDLVYWNLCKQYPQHRRQLHRTQTPHSPVVVRYSDPSITDTFEKKNLYDANYDKGRGIPVTSGGVASNSDEQCDQATEQMTLSNTSTKTNSLSQCEATYNKTQTTQENSKLITTYMCESVMHILDDLREEQGLYRLSPRRPGISSLSEPYRVYNSWSRGWSKGFESV
ncbi:uncharacterized protein LOC127876110 [Dreissena polymorpha]|nr:uncharacterized protein LOC127876110 [Dreissena polymorpha]